MRQYYMKITDSKEAEVLIDAENDHDALNVGLNALAKFACQRFPPPENIVISVSDDQRMRIATLQMTFSIDYERGFVN